MTYPVIELNRFFMGIEESIQQLKHGLKQFLEQELKNYPPELQPQESEKQQIVNNLAALLLKKDNRPNPSLHKETLQEIFRSVLFMQVLVNKNIQVNKDIFNLDFCALAEKRLDELSPEQRTELTHKFIESLENLKKVAPDAAPFIDTLQDNFNKMMEDPDLNKTTDEVFSDALSKTLTMKPTPFKTKTEELEDEKAEIADEARANRRMVFRVDPDVTGEIPQPLICAFVNPLAWINYNPNPAEDSLTIDQDAYAEPIDTLSEVMHYLAHQKDITLHQ